MDAKTESPSIVSAVHTRDLTPVQRKLYEERMAEHRADPTAVIPWVPEHDE
jgi:hypothetical protein